jgi:hypothetical protein
VSSNLQIPIQKYAQPTLMSSLVVDNSAPFSYKEWLKLYQGIIPGQEFKQYNTYLTDWYKQKSKLTTDSKTQIKLNYLALLKQLQLYFSKEETENWYNNVDIENEKELLLAIPYFARKLKEISLYYLQFRETIKQTRLHYNQIGTNTNIVKQLQNLIFSNYTQKSNQIINIPFSVWNHIPQLSGVTNTLSIQIEELYDKENYLDKSPTVTLSNYFDINNAELQTFLATKGLALTSTEWIYKGGIFPLSANYINLSSEDISTLINSTAEKYLGQNKFITFQNLTSSIQTDQYTMFIVTGDNYFLWPGTPYQSKAKTLPIYRPTSIQDLNILDLATGGQDLSTSDKIFVKTVKGIEGAWLANQPTVYSSETMNAVFDANSKVAFRFPYPGYGLSAEGYNWTGVSLTADPQFFYLEDTVKQVIENEYWTTTLNTVSCSPLKINNSTLVNNKAFPNLNYSLADKVIVRSIPPQYNATSYTNETNEAWLYRLNQTDISIRANSENVIYWPYERVEQTENYPQYFPNNPGDVCSPIPISSINVPFAIPGSDLSVADVIYKITNYLSVTADATECCWLSGSNTNFPLISAFTTIQNSFQGVYSPGIYIKFLWLGKNNTDVDLVFKSLNHQTDCKYVTNNLDYTAPEECTCNQVLFTPFGHPGENFTDYNSLADYIVEDNSIFNQLDTTTIPTSSLCWFKTNSVQGWGDGRWYTTRANTNNKFYLQTGKIYAYYRATLQDPSINFPPLVVRYNFDTYNNNYNVTHKWIRAYKDLNGNWVNSNEPSKMVLHPGDLLLYNRRGTTSYTLTSLISLSSYIGENRESIWSNVDYLTINDGSFDAFNQSFTLNWPTNVYLTTNVTNQQYPKIPSNDIIEFRDWTVVHEQSNQTYVYPNTPSVTISPTLEGTYLVTVRAITGTQPLTGIYTFTNIPKITAISPVTQVVSLTTYPVPMPGFVLNTPLKGWDYNLNAPATITSYQNIGAKPLWVKSNKNYKNYNYTGVVPRLLDFHNVVYQPEISDIIFSLGQYVEYVRNYPADLNWLQPLTFATKKDIKQWYTLQIETPQSNLNSNFSDLVLTPTLSESTIILQNYVNNEPVEIYYNAIQPFIWQISATPEINQPQYPLLSSTLGIEAKVPWANLTNIQFPTVATFPTLDKLYSTTDCGGFFIPNSLGASKYVNHNYSFLTSSSASTLTAYFEDPNSSIKSRGFTNQDQPTPYKVINNSVWLKEPVTTGPIAGTINKKVFKKYQKFIPYQSKYETNPNIKLGLVLPDSRQTPWGGKQDSVWTDFNNQPISPTGELNVKKWADDQILKQTNLQLDNWVTDIFGNQYGLYKDFSNVESVNRKNIAGEIWTRSNKQFVGPASKSLKRVFDTYKNTNIVNELTGHGVRKIETFYDTLYIETSGAIIFEKLNYDFETDTIFSTTDDARFISLAEPVSLNFDKEFNNINLTEYRFAKAGDTWFFPELKKVLINVNNINYAPDEIYYSTFSWEFKLPNTNSFVLSGTVPLPENSQYYLVSIGGVIQPYTTFTVSSATRTLTFNNTPPSTVYVILLYNPAQIEEYDYLPTQFVTSSPVLTSKFLLNDFANLTPYEGQYIVTIDGVLQRPKNLSNNLQTLENSYTILTTPPAIEFTESVQPNLPITITRLPQHLKCISPSPFYTWVYTFNAPTKTINFNTGPEIISDSAAYIVNIGGVLQAASDFILDRNNKTITFIEPVPANVYISITQLSVPQRTIPETSLYELDLNTQNLSKVFPITPNHINTLNQLTDLRIIELKSASISYNSVKNELLLSVLGKNCNEEDIILEIVLTYNPVLEIKTFTVYESLPQKGSLLPPVIADNLYTSLSTTATSVNELNIQLNANEEAVTFVPVNLPTWVTLTETGTFTGTAPKQTQLYNAEFYIQNAAGSTYYNLIINVVSLNI